MPNTMPETFNYHGGGPGLSSVGWAQVPVSGAQQMEPGWAGFYYGSGCYVRDFNLAKLSPDVAAVGNVVTLRISAGFLTPDNYQTYLVGNVLQLDYPDSSAYVKIMDSDGDNLLVAAGADPSDPTKITLLRDSNEHLKHRLIFDQGNPSLVQHYEMDVYIGDQVDLGLCDVEVNLGAVHAYAEVTNTNTDPPTPYDWPLNENKEGPNEAQADGDYHVMGGALNLIKIQWEYPDGTSEDKELTATPAEVINSIAAYAAGTEDATEDPIRDVNIDFDTTWTYKLHILGYPPTFPLTATLTGMDVNGNIQEQKSVELEDDGTGNGVISKKRIFVHHGALSDDAKLMLQDYVTLQDDEVKLKVVQPGPAEDMPSEGDGAYLVVYTNETRQAELDNPKDLDLTPAMVALGNNRTTNTNAIGETVIDWPNFNFTKGAHKYTFSVAGLHDGYVKIELKTGNKQRGWIMVIVTSRVLYAAKLSTVDADRLSTDSIRAEEIKKKGFLLKQDNKLDAAGFLRDDTPVSTGRLSVTAFACAIESRAYRPHTVRMLTHSTASGPYVYVQGEAGHVPTDGVFIGGGEGWLTKIYDKLDLKKPLPGAEIYLYVCTGHAMATALASHGIHVHATPNLFVWGCDGKWGEAPPTEPWFTQVKDTAAWQGSVPYNKPHPPNNGVQGMALEAFGTLDLPSRSSQNARINTMKGRFPTCAFVTGFDIVQETQLQDYPAH